jgi:RNA polymerase sigma factor (sigma-70 family)
MPDPAPLNPVRRKVASRANLLGRMELVEQLAHPAREEQRVNGEDDQARFARVVLPHLADAYALARWLTGDGADAEDVVQDACLRAFRGISRFGEGSARAWVLTIVRHTAYTWLGKNRPATLIVTDDLEAVERVELARRGTDADADTPETELIAKADAASLEAAIKKLPPPFRETLVLRDVQGLDYKEIAKVTGVPIGTVMSRLARARQRVMATIAKD